MPENNATQVGVTGMRGLPASWGGVERQCEALYTRLAAQGWRVLAYARSTYVPKGTTEVGGVAVKVLPALKSTFLETIGHTFLSVVHMALFVRPRIVHVYSQGPCLLLPLVRLLMPSAKVFYTCGGIDWQRAKWPGWASQIIRLGEWFSARLTHGRIMVSTELARYYKQRYGVDCLIIPNGVDLPAQVSSEALGALGLESGRYLVFIGRLTPEKGVDDLISAYLARPRKLKLVIVGEDASAGGYMQQLRNLAGGNPDVIFTGYRFGQELAALFAHARAYVSASELEGMPLTLLEAMSYALPCVVSDLPPHLEVLGPHRRFVFAVHDVAALSSLISEIEGASLESLSLEGQTLKSRVAASFSWDLAAKRLQTVYDQALRGMPLDLGDLRHE